MTSVVGSPLVPQVLKQEGTIARKTILCENMSLILAHGEVKGSWDATSCCLIYWKFSMTGAIGSGLVRVKLRQYL